MTSALGVIIGLAAVYSAFALLASWIQEQIAGIAGLRAATLKSGLLCMIGNIETHAKLLQQPTIASAQPNPQREPSYLSAHQFSSAVISLVNGASAVTMTGAQAFDQLVAGIEALPESRLKNGLLSMAGTVNKDVGALKKSIEDWFDDQMDRVSGWYKRRTQIVLIVLGLALAAAFNVDTLRIGYNFTHAPLPVDAAKLAAANSAAAQQYVTALVFQNVALGWPDAPYCAPAQAASAPACAEPPWNFKRSILKIIGLLLTAIALSFGAPFWFDTLTRFTNLRNSGPPPQPGGTSRT